jgi:hypothetical protein
MPCTIQNTSPHRVVLRLNSGRTRHLPPGTEASRVPDAEVRGNAQVQRLRDRRAISVRRRVQSTELTAREAIAHIRNTPEEDLEDFLAEDEDRKTVREAWEEKHADG